MTPTPTATGRSDETLPGLLATWARRRPGGVAIRVKRLGVWQEITWRDYFAATEAAAHGLRALGVGPGDHVAILSENRPEWLFVDLAAQGIGARSVGIYQTNPPNDVAYILNHCGSSVLFCEDQEQVDKAVAVASETPRVRHVVVFEPRGTRTYADARLRSWDAFLEQGRARAAREPDWFACEIRARDPAAPSMVVYTSGTTGEPKGAMLSSRNARAQQCLVDALGITEDDQLLSYLPLCHVAEKIFTVFIPLAAGCVTHFGESIDTVREDVREVSPTIFLGVPRIWEKMHAAVSVRMEDASWLKRTVYRWGTRLGHALAERRRAGPLAVRDRVLRFVADVLLFRPLQERLGMRRCRLPYSGAAPIAPDLLRWFHAIGVEVLEGYGQTECAGVSHSNLPGRMRFGTVGPALPTMACRIGEDGEILLRGPGVFVGYLHDDATTRQTVDAQGWLHTGDIGAIEADGSLRITGRKKEILITQGGKNISPEHVENALKMSPFINEAVAVGDGEKFVAALIQIDYDVVANWASGRRLQYTSYADLACKDEVVKLVQREIDRCNRHVSHVEHVKAFRMLPKELHQDDGELTPTRKVRRRAVCERYRDLIDSIYRPGS